MSIKGEICDDIGLLDDSIGMRRMPCVVSESRSIETGTDGSVVKQDSTFLFVLLLVASKTARKIPSPVINEKHTQWMAVVVYRKHVKARESTAHPQKGKKSINDNTNESGADCSYSR